jgi:hypothetical protein
LRIALCGSFYCVTFFIDVTQPNLGGLDLAVGHADYGFLGVVQVTPDPQQAHQLAPALVTSGSHFVADLDHLSVTLCGSINLVT